MRELMTLLKANIRSSKKSFFSIVVLLFIVSVSVTSVMTVRANSEVRVSEAMKEAGFGQLWAAFVDKKVQEKGMELEELKTATEGCHVVDKVNTTEIIWVDIWTINDSSSNNSLMFMNQGDGGIEYKFFDGAGKTLMDDAPALKKGEIAVPIAFQSLHNCQLGDTLQVNVNGSDYSLNVKYFIEDPIMGSSMMGLKTLLVSKADLEYLKNVYKEAPENSTIAKGTVFHVFQKEESQLSGMKLEQAINKETALSSYATIQLTASQASGYMLMLVNIFSGVLMVFIVLLIIVALIIIGHSISNSMEMDYVNMGVLKAIGFTGAKLKAVYVLQYMLAVVAGSVLGFPCAIPVITLVNELTKPATGLQVSNDIAYGVCISILLGIIGIIVLFVLGKLRKISSITPVRAIRGGRGAVYFKSRLQAGIYKKGLDAWMALRQITSNKRQYISGCLIAALLVFFLGMTSSMKVFMGSDGDSLNALFGAYEEDFKVYYGDASLRDEVEDIIVSYSPITSDYGVFHQQLSVEGSQINTLIVEQPEVIQNILKGRVCKYDNEIVLTEFLAKELGVEMGDSLLIQSGQHKKEYLITGYYQNANDLGSNFAMTGKGYERLTGEDTSSRWFRVYNVKDETQVDAICDAVEQRYAEDVVKASVGNFSGLDSVVGAVDALVTLTYVIAAIFVLIAIVLICSKLFLKEQRDYGIYKAVGFDSGRLRRQFAARFGTVAILGGFLGVLLYLATGNLCAATIFYFVGVSSFEANTGLLPVVVPFVFVAGLFCVFSWLTARRIKKTTPRILIQE